MILVADQPRQNRQDKTNSPFWRNLSFTSILPFLFFPSPHININTKPSPSFQVASTSRLYLSLRIPHLFLNEAYQSIMASEKTPEVGDKGTWSFLQRVAREQPFSFCAFYTSI